MSDKAAKLDPTGQPFRVRQRGGKNVRKQKELHERVEAGEYEPRHRWSEVQREAKTRPKLLGGGVVEGCSVGSTSEGPVCSSEVRVLTPRTPKGNNPPWHDPAEVTGPQLASPLPSAASSGSRVPSVGSGLASEGFGGGFGSSSGSKAKRKLELAEPASSKARSKAPAVETSFRVVSDFHGVLDHGDRFTRTSQDIIRNFLQQSPFHQFLILSYIGVKGPKSQERRNNLRSQAAEFQRSLRPELASRFGVAIVSSKAAKAELNQQLQPILFVDDQQPLVEAPGHSAS